MFCFLRSIAVDLKTTNVLYLALGTLDLFFVFVPVSYVFFFLIFFPSPFRVPPLRFSSSRNEKGAVVFFLVMYVGSVCLGTSCSDRPHECTEKAS